MDPRLLSFFVPLCLAASAAAQVSGFVFDATTVMPIKGAMVSVQATNQRTTTAADGSFSLPNAVGTVVVVAAHKGHFYESTTVTAPAPHVRLLMESVTVHDDPSYSFVDPAACAACHPDQYSQWLGSPMAKAGTNTWVQDIYDGGATAGGMGGFVYLRDSSVAPTNPESECASCHQPELWVEQGIVPLDPVASASPAALHGISCEVCHKIANVDASKSNFPGIWPGVVELNRPASPLLEHQVVYGVQGDVSYELPGLMRASYNPQLLAEACAACHQDKNDPDHDGDFEEANGVISEPTYLEWLASPYGDPSSPQYKSCVECHMPAFGATDFCTVAPVTRNPSTIRSHAILGTTPEYLDNAVDLSVQVQQNPTSLDVTVDVANTQTGHHVPTGVTIRNMVLVVDAWSVDDGQYLGQLGGPTVHALGGVGDRYQGYYAGLPGKLYAKHNHDVNGNGPTFFTDATGILWDTRIPALATDTTNYQFAIPAGVGELRVRARLIYRRAFRAFVDAKQWTTDGHGNPLEDIAPPYYGHLMEEAEWSSGSNLGVEAFGVACDGLAIGTDGLPSIGNTAFAFELSGADPSVPVALGIGASATMMGNTPLPIDLSQYGAGGCWIHTSLDALIPTSSDANGASRVALPLPNEMGAVVGVEFYVQWLASDAAMAPLGWATSDALRVVIQP